MEIQKEDKILIASVEDKIEQCQERYTIVTTGFLDARQRGLVEARCKADRNLSPLFITENKKANSSEREVERKKRITIMGKIGYCFEGGYPDAERRILMFIPDYADVTETMPLRVMRVSPAKGTRKLTHRDYLGSILGLGIKREMVGDILVYENGADIIILEEIEKFLMSTYNKAGRIDLEVKIVPTCEIRLSEENIEDRQDTVASLRLDNIVAAVFDISRSSAVEAISRGLVLVNNREVFKADMQVKENDKIVLRGKGKVVLTGIGGISRKGRTYIKYNKYA